MNTGTKKKTKLFHEINPQLGRNQIIQHCVKCLITKAFKEKPTKQEFLEFFWNEAEKLILDLDEVIETGKQPTNQPKRKTSKRVEVSESDLL